MLHATHEPAFVVPLNPDRAGHPVSRPKLHPPPLSQSLIPSSNSFGDVLPQQETPVPALAPVQIQPIRNATTYPNADSIPKPTANPDACADPNCTAKPASPTSNLRSTVAIAMATGMAMDSAQLANLWTNWRPLSLIRPWP